MKKFYVVLLAICLLPTMLLAKSKKNEVTFRLNLKPGMEFTVVSEVNFVFATSLQSKWGNDDGLITSKQTLSVRCEVLALADTNYVIGTTLTDCSLLDISNNATTLLNKDPNGKVLVDQPKVIQNEKKKTEEDFPWVKLLYGQQIKVVVTPHGKVMKVEGWDELVAGLGEYVDDKSYEELLASMENADKTEFPSKADPLKYRSQNLLLEIRTAMQLAFLRGYYPSAPVKVGKGWTLYTPRGENHSVLTMASVEDGHAKITSSVKDSEIDKLNSSSLSIDVEGLYDLQTGLYDSLKRKTLFECASNEVEMKMQTKDDASRIVYIKF